MGDAIVKVYISAPISGRSAEEVFAYYDSITKRLADVGYTILSPMAGKDHLRSEAVMQPSGYEHWLSNDHAVYERDLWMVRQSDIVLIDLSGAIKSSHGCITELAWAKLLGKHTVRVLSAKDTLHRGPFLDGNSDITLPDIDEAIDYLGTLIKSQRKGDNTPYTEFSLINMIGGLS